MKYARVKVTSMGDSVCGEVLTMKRYRICWLLSIEKSGTITMNDSYHINVDLISS